MKAALRTWGMLAWPGVAVLLCGLPALLRTGQVDPRNWMLPALLLVPAAALLKARRGEGVTVWAALGTAGMVASAAYLAAWERPLLTPLLCLSLIILLATAAGMLLMTVRRWWAVALLCAALATWWLSMPGQVQPSLGKRAELAVITGLPLFWREDGVKADAPIITLLRQRFDVQPVDSPSALQASRVRRALIAQPRAFSMEEMVALDDWLRKGGRAVLLTDPELRWPMELPLGDRRRPPSVTLLAGLIEAWGIRLKPPVPGEVRHFLGDGRVLTLYSGSGFAAGQVQPLPQTICRVLGRGLIARCAVGAGEAVIVADADLIDDRLWLADADQPLRPDRWTADTPQFLTEALGSDLPVGRRWVRSGDALVQAVRWAVLAGIFWAALGAALFRGRNPSPSGGLLVRLTRRKWRNEG